MVNTQTCTSCLNGVKKNLATKSKEKIGWKHDQLDIKSSCHSCNHIFAHKCKKVESKHFQPLSNHHVAQEWVYNLLYTKFESLSYNKSRCKVFLKHIGQNVLKNNFTLESLIYYYF
jgi:disulfide oxidoreductase YuzD